MEITPSLLALQLVTGIALGAVYALLAIGLSLIFGMLTVVNFAHGEFLMLAMYATFGLVFMTALDPVVLAPLVVALIVAVKGLLVIRHYMGLEEEGSRLRGVMRLYFVVVPALILVAGGAGWLVA